MNYALDIDETQTLINALHANEVNAIEQFRYSRPLDQINDLKDCARAYEEANSLFQMEKEQSASPENENTQNVWQAARAGILFSYETIKNFKLRSEYLSKIHDAINSFKYNPATGQFDKFNNSDDFDLIDENQDYYDTITKSIQEWANKTSRAWGNTVAYKKKPFDDFMKDKDVNLERYVVKNAGKDQLQLLSYMRYFGVTLIIFTLGVIIWQLVKAQDKVAAGTDILVSAGGAIGGGYLGEIGGTALFGWLIGDVGTAIGGILGGIVGAFVGGIAAESLFDAMMDAFFYTPQQDQMAGKLFSGPIMYELSLPDNMTLSNNLTRSLTAEGGK